MRMPLVENLFTSTVKEAAKLHNTIDFLAIAIFVSFLPIFLTVIIGCLIVILMKGPAYIADRYDLNDADKPDNDDKEPEMWEHYCEEEETEMAVGKGEPCNWCGKEEEDCESCS